MQLPTGVALSLILADIALGGALTTIEPCKQATKLTVAPITVTSQYQPVSTCNPTTACVKGKCSTIFPFTTFPFVSTVVPHAWDGSTAQKTTITDVNQALRVAEHLETLTTITAAPTGDRRAWIDWFARKNGGNKSITLYETVTRRSVAPFSECGPLAIPGWEGSGLCKKCDQLEDGSRAQLLDVTECRSGSDAAGKKYQKCAGWFETLISRPAPTSTVTANAQCSSQGRIPSAGTYTWTFPQTAPPVTITAPPRTVTITVGGRQTISVDPKKVFVIPGRHWNAYVTKSFSGATTFNFNVYVTKVIIFNIPNFTKPATSTRPVPIPTGSGGKNGNGWPLPNNNGNSNYGGDGGKEWADWSPNTKTVTATKTETKTNTVTTTSTSGGLGPVYPSTSSSSSSSILYTFSSYSTSSTSDTSSLSTTTSFSLSQGPIDQGTTTSSSLTSSTSSRAIDSPIEFTTSTTSTLSTTSGITTSTLTTTADSLTTTSSVSVSLGPVSPTTSSSTSDAGTSSTSSVDPNATSSTSSSLTTTSSSSFSQGPIDGTTTSSSSSTVSTSTSSAPVTTTTAPVAPICQLNANICLNAQLITANTIVTAQCPLGIGLLCTVNQLLNLVPQILTNNPNVLSVIVGNNQVLGLSITPQQVQAGILDGTLTSVCAITGPVSVVINDPTCPINPTTSSTTLTTTSSSTSAPATTTTTAPVAPVCNLAVSVCPNSPALISATVTTVGCPLGIGLLCTVNQLLSLVPQLLQSNPNVLSVVLGDNQVLGLNISPQQVQALALAGSLTGVCTALQQINIVVSDPTCPLNPGTSTTSSTTTTSAAPAATTTAANNGAQCGTVVQLCAGQTLQSLGLTQVSCSLGVPLLCTLVQLATDVTNACVALPGGCSSVGRIGTGLNVLGATGLIGTQSVAQIQAAIGGVQNCQPSGQFLTISDPTCAASGLLKRSGPHYRY